MKAFYSYSCLSLFSRFERKFEHDISVLQQLSAITLIAYNSPLGPASTEPNGAGWSKDGELLLSNLTNCVIAYRSEPQEPPAFDVAWKMFYGNRK